MGAAILMALANFAPLLTKYLGAGDTTQKIAESASAVAQAITGASSPQEAVEKLAASTEAQQKFKLEMDKQSAEWDRMYLADTQNARQRDIELRKVGDKNTRANVLVVVTFIIVILCFVVVVWMSDLNEYTKGIITLILGRALGWVEQIMSFEFGTTRSSKKKDDTIQSLSSDCNRSLKISLSSC